MCIRLSFSYLSLSPPSLSRPVRASASLFSPSARVGDHAFSLTGRPGHRGRRGGRRGRGRRLAVRRRRRGRQRLGRPGRDHLRLGRVHAAVTALRVLHGRVVVALAEELGPGRGLRRALRPGAASAHVAGSRGGRGRRRVRRFRGGHRVVFLPLGPPVLEPDLDLLTITRRSAVSTRDKNDNNNLRRDDVIMRERY